MVCPLQGCGLLRSEASGSSSEEVNQDPLLDAISYSVRVCLAVAKHTESAKIYHQNRKRCHKVGCWGKVKRFLCCCCCAEKEWVEGKITGLGLWMQEHIHSHGILITGYAVHLSGVCWENMLLAGGTLSPGDQRQLKAALENSSTTWMRLMLDSSDGKVDGLFSPARQEDLFAQYREKVGIGNLADAVALRHFCNRT